MGPLNKRKALECGRLRPVQHAAIILTSLAMILSGAALWYIRHALDAPEEDFSVFRHPSEPWWLWLHALAAPPFLAAVASSAYRHMKRNFEAGLHRASGVLLVALIFVMTYSGYLLYLVGNGGARKAVLWTHLASGTAFVVLFAWHTVVGRLANLALDRTSGRRPPHQAGQPFAVCDGEEYRGQDPYRGSDARYPSGQPAADPGEVEVRFLKGTAPGINGSPEKRR